MPSYFFKGKDESSVWSSALQTEHLHELHGKEDLRTEQGIRFVYSGGCWLWLHLSTAKRQTWQFPGLAVTCSSCFSLIYDDFVAVRGFACFPRATGSLSTTSSNTLRSSLQAATLTSFFTWTSHGSAAAGIRKGKITQKNPKTGNSLHPLPAVQNVILFHSSDAHTGHHSRDLQKVVYIEGDNTLITRCFL